MNKTWFADEESMRALFPAKADDWPAHPEPLQTAALAVKALPEVQLRDLREADYPTLERWMRVPDVHGFLEYDTPPNRHEIKVAVLGRRLQPLLIEHAGQAVGFFALYYRGLAAAGTREFDIAVPEARQRGIAQAAIRAFESWCFDDQGLRGVWAKIFTDNRPCLELVRACGWPLSPVHQAAVSFRDEDRDLVYTWMRPDIRQSLTARRGF